MSVCKAARRPALARFLPELFCCMDVSEENGCGQIVNLSMAGIDHSTADLDTRQHFGFSKSRQQQILHGLLAHPQVLGAALLATCNRTELYLSCEEGAELDPFDLLCQAAQMKGAPFRSMVRVRRGRDCFYHLCRLSCGALSQIWGEDQIITQVKNAIALARQEHCADSVLEVCFRYAVTAAKRIKTEIRFTRSNASVATKTQEALERFVPRPQRVLVIGNGEVGRLVASTLVQAGFSVGMTLRQYKYGQVPVPTGVDAFEYGQRYQRLPYFDAVVSATASPHFTLEAPAFLAVPQRPRLLIDLAVPRDIDPRCAAVGAQLLDLDTLSGSAIQEDHAQVMEQADAIIEKYRQDFLNWERYRQAASAS